MLLSILVHRRHRNWHGKMCQWICL